MGEYAAVCCCEDETPTCECVETVPEDAGDLIRLRGYYSSSFRDFIMTEQCGGPGTCAVASTPLVSTSEDSHSIYVEWDIYLQCARNQNTGRFYWRTTNALALEDYPNRASMAASTRIFTTRLNEDRNGCEGGSCTALDYGGFLFAGGFEDAIHPVPPGVTNRHNISCSSVLLPGTAYLEPGGDPEGLGDAIRKVKGEDWDWDPNKWYRETRLFLAPQFDTVLNIVGRTYLPDPCTLFSVQNDFFDITPQSWNGAMGRCCLGVVDHNQIHVCELEECDIFEFGEEIYNGGYCQAGFPDPGCGQFTYFHEPAPYEEIIENPPEDPFYCGDLPSCCGFGGPGATIRGTYGATVTRFGNSIFDWTHLPAETT